MIVVLLIVLLAIGLAVREATTPRVIAFPTGAVATRASPIPLAGMSNLYDFYDAETAPDAVAGTSKNHQGKALEKIA